MISSRRLARWLGGVIERHRDPGADKRARKLK